MMRCPALIRHRGEGMSQRDESWRYVMRPCWNCFTRPVSALAELVGPRQSAMFDLVPPHDTGYGKGSKQRVVPSATLREGAGRLEGAWPTIDIAQSRCGHSRYGRVVPRHARPPHRPAYRARCRASCRPRERGARYQPAFAAAQRGDAHAGRGERTCARFRRCSAIRRCALRSGTRMCRSSS